MCATTSNIILTKAIWLLISSDFSRGSITHPWLLLLLWYFFSYFNFYGKRLDRFCCNFAGIFGMLLLNRSQCLNKFEMVFWDIFAFFSLQYVDLDPQNWYLYRANSKKNHNKQTHCKYKISPLYEQKQTTLHFCRKQFFSFEDFNAFFCTFNWGYSERDAIWCDFKWESHQVE